MLTDTNKVEIEQRLHTLECAISNLKELNITDNFVIMVLDKITDYNNLMNNYIDEFILND